MNNTTTEKVLLARNAAVRIIACWRREQHGSSMIEFALVLPVMLLVMTGIFSFAVAINHQQQLTQAVGAGGQYLQQIRTTTTDPCHDVYTAITSASPNLTASSITLTLTLNGTVVSGTSCSGSQSHLTQGGSAAVAATYPCTLTAYKYSFGSCTLSAKVTEYEY